MLLMLGAAVALNFQVVQPDPAHRRPPVVRASISDSTSTGTLRRRQGRRRAVPADLLATAHKDQTAKSTLLHARAARLAQGSALVACDAMSHERTSVGLGFGRSGRDRLLFRHEAAAHV